MFERTRSYFKAWLLALLFPLVTMAVADEVKKTEQRLRTEFQQQLAEATKGIETINAAASRPADVTGLAVQFAGALAQFSELQKQVREEFAAKFQNLRSESSLQQSQKFAALETQLYERLAQFEAARLAMETELGNLQRNLHEVEVRISRWNQSFAHPRSPFPAMPRI